MKFDVTEHLNQIARIDALRSEMRAARNDGSTWRSLVRTAEKVRANESASDAELALAARIMADEILVLSGAEERPLKVVGK